MSKVCTVCKKPYPDELLACPHCAAAPRSRAERDPELTSDSVIDLGSLPGSEISKALGAHAKMSEPPSGTSHTDWSSLASQPEVPITDEPILIDSPSDASLLGSDTGGDNTSRLEIVAETDTSPEDAADATQMPTHFETPAPGGPGRVRPRTMLAPPSPEEAAQRSRRIEATDSTELLPGEVQHAQLQTRGEDSDTHETRTEELSAAGQPGDAKAPKKGSGVDLFEEEAPQEPASDAHETPVGDLGSGGQPPEAEGYRRGSGVDLFEEDILEEHDSAVNLGAAAPAAAGSERPSDRDLIAESVESGVDLNHPTEEFSGTVSEDEAASLLSGEDIHNLSTLDEGDSAVDLGAYEDAETATDVSGLAREPVYSEIEVNLTDLQQRPTTAAGSQSRLKTTDVDIKHDTTDVVEEEAEEIEPPKSRAAMPWIGGGAVGAVVGSAAACLVLWLGGFLSPAGEASLSQPSSTQPAVSVPPAPAPVQQGPEMAALYLRYGDIDKAMPMLEDPGVDPAIRGEAIWLNYLKEQKRQKATLKAEDESFKKAVADLSTAKNAEAAFWLGQIREQTGDVDGARKIYQDALKQFPEPAAQRRFQAALDRLEATAADQPGADASSSRLTPPRDSVAADTAAVLLLALLQADTPAEKPANPAGKADPQDKPAVADQASAPAPEPVEAGFAFWKAVLLARQQKYDEAIKTLQEARAAHDQRRFFRLRKAQNPDSDPNEEIFLRSVDELQTYWRLRQALQASGTLTAKQRDPLVALKALAANQPMLEAVRAKLMEDKSVPDAKDVVKAVDQLLEVKKTAEKQVLTLEDKFKTASKAADDAVAATKAAEEKLKTADESLASANGQLKEVTTQLDAAGIKQADPVKGVGQLIVDRKKADTTLDELAKKLADHLAVPADKTKVAAALDQVLKVAKEKDPKQLLGQLQTELADSKENLKHSHTPKQMLDVWMPVVADRSRKDVAEQARADAQRVLAIKEAPKEDRAKALCVEGMALRNEGEYDKARDALEQGLKDSAAKEGGWQALARKSLKELTDPAAYYLPHAQELRRAGQPQAALAVLAEGVAAFPKDGRLLALRSLVRLDAARAKAKGSVAANDPELTAAAKDAAAAVAAGAAAEGHYAVGRIAEAAGDWATARQSYQQALEAHPADDATGGQYRVALARALLRTTAPQPTTPPKEPAPAEKTTAADLSRDPIADARASAVLTVLTLLLTMADPEDKAPLSSPDLDQAIKLADQAIAAKNYEGHLIKGRALAQKGLWTDALSEYVAGLRKLIPAEYGEGLAELVDNHPAFKRPPGLQPPDTLAADQYYAAGLQHFFERRYPEAEKAFFEAVRYNDQDARYLYFLGLTRLTQGKREDAMEDFRLAARLEQQSRPSKAAVSTALERVQGTTRQTLNSFRP